LNGTWKDELSASDIAKADFIEMDLPTALSYHDQLTQMDDGDIKKQALDKIDEKINCYKAIIQHEEAHAQQFKFFAHKYRSYIIPFLTIIPFMILFTKFINPRLNKNLAGRLIAPLLAFMGSRISNRCLSYPWGRYLEKKADDAIENDPSVLLAFKKYCKNFITFGLIQYHHKISGSTDMYINNPKLMNFLNAVLTLDHPTPATRIKRIDQRLAQIAENAAK
jgi:Zn-dependent protease with chaperone function